MNEFTIFQIGNDKHDNQHRFIIAPRDQENAIDASLKEDEFIDSYSTLNGVLGGKTEIRLGLESLEDQNRKLDYMLRALFDAHYGTVYHHCGDGDGLNKSDALAIVTYIRSKTKQ